MALFRLMIPLSMLLSVLSACGGKTDATDDTASVVDADNDGWDEESDCDDDDASIHPEAEETPGDGVDSNCDGDDDT